MLDQEFRIKHRELQQELVLNESILVKPVGSAKSKYLRWKDLYMHKLKHLFHSTSQTNTNIDVSINPSIF